MGNGVGPPAGGSHYVGHNHFWERAMSRRAFMGTTAGAAAAMATPSLWFPTLAAAGGRVAGAAPTAIPGGFAPGLHAFLGPGVEPASIFNYRGVTGVATVQGTGTGRNTLTGEETGLVFDSDNRFMHGEYVGEDGHRHKGTFGFV